MPNRGQTITSPASDRAHGPHLSGVAASLGSTSEGSSCHDHSWSSGVIVCSSSGDVLEGSLPLPSLPLPLPLRSRKLTSGRMDVGEGGGDLLAMLAGFPVSMLCRLCTESLMPAGASLRDLLPGSATCNTPALLAATGSKVLSGDALLRFRNRPRPGIPMLRAFDCLLALSSQSGNPNIG